MKRQVLGTWQQTMKIIRANKRMNSKWNDLYGYREIDVEQICFKDRAEFIQWIKNNPQIIIQYELPPLHSKKSYHSTLNFDLFIITLTL